MSSLHSQVGKDKEAMEEEYKKPLELIFSYGYRCCVFKHNIRGDHPEVPDGMSDSSDPLSPEFFVNPRCPLAPTTIEAIATEVDQSKAAKEPERSASTEDQSLSLSYFFSLPFFRIFCKGPYAAARTYMYFLELLTLLVYL